MKERKGYRGKDLEQKWILRREWKPQWNKVSSVMKRDESWPATVSSVVLSYSGL